MKGGAWAAPQARAFGFEVVSACHVSGSCRLHIAVGKYNGRAAPAAAHPDYHRKIAGSTAAQRVPLGGRSSRAKAPSCLHATWRLRGQGCRGQRSTAGCYQAVSGCRHIRRSRLSCRIAA